MKHATKLALLCAVLITIGSAKAQNSLRLNLFDNFSNTLNCSTSELERLFNVAEGNTVALSFPGNIHFIGTITSSIQRYHNLKSVVVKFDSFQGAIFSISRRTDNENAVTYVGRILNTQYADGYELIKNSSGYSLNKIKTDDLIQDRD